jgi:hypothetical protein
MPCKVSQEGPSRFTFQLFLLKQRNSWKSKEEVTEDNDFWGCSSVVQLILSMQEALGESQHPKEETNNQHKTKQNDSSRWHKEWTSEYILLSFSGSQFPY